MTSRDMREETPIPAKKKHIKDSRPSSSTHRDTRFMLIYTNSHPPDDTITLGFSEGTHMRVTATRDGVTRRVAAAYASINFMDRLPFPYDDARLEHVLTASHLFVRGASASPALLYLTYAPPVRMFSITGVTLLIFFLEGEAGRSPVALTRARTIARGLPYNADEETEEQDQ
jgi:hypothetical protein